MAHWPLVYDQPYPFAKEYRKHIFSSSTVKYDLQEILKLF